MVDLNEQTLYLIRGVPGSGKSTIAKALMKALKVDAHYEADQYFIMADEYIFVRGSLGQAHLWCELKTKTALENKLSVVVANTFITLDEMYPYVDMAEQLGINCVVIVAGGDYGSIHDVPAEKIQSMRDRWED